MHIEDVEVPARFMIVLWPKIGECKSGDVYYPALLAKCLLCF